jgi:uncharacterized membrane protein YdjX (TVP38/TMEM64 family)
MQKQNEASQLDGPVEPENEKTRPVPRSLWRRVLPLGLVLLAGALVSMSGVTDFLSVAALVEHRDMLKEFVAQHVWLTWLGFTLLYLTLVAVSIPGAGFLTVIGGFVFGWLAGGLATLIGASLGAMIIFLIARSSLGDSLRKKAGPALTRMAKGFQEEGIYYLLFLRLVPVFPFWLVNLVPAFLGVSFRTFALSTIIGIAPGTFAFALAGSGLDDLIAAHKNSNAACQTGQDCALTASDLISQDILMAFGLLGLIALVPPLWKRYRKHTPLE